MEFSGVQMAMKFEGQWIAIAFWGPAILLFVVTFLASLLPAIRAARLKPVDALGRT
jgi:ABC-type antimicrobial peptide transport system permease subunit